MKRVQNKQNAKNAGKTQNCGKSCGGNCCGDHANKE